MHLQLVTTLLTEDEECTVAMLCKVADRVARMSTSIGTGSMISGQPKFRRPLPPSPEVQQSMANEFNTLRAQMQKLTSTSQR